MQAADIKFLISCSNYFGNIIIFDVEYKFIILRDGCMKKNEIKPSIVWFRQDLRLDDHPALHAAVAKGGPVIPLYVWAPQEEGEWAPGSASRWWLHHSLKLLQQEFKTLGSSLIIRSGGTLKVLLELIGTTGAEDVFWSIRYEPSIVARDVSVQAELEKRGIKTHLFNSSLLYDPSDILTKEGKPYQVFTPFWKACQRLGEPPQPLERPQTIQSYPKRIASDPLESLSLLPKITWDAGISIEWQPGSQAAERNLKQTIDHVVRSYDEWRNFPALEGTSRLSPYLHFGEISPRRIWHEVCRAFKVETVTESFLRQLIWREFAYYLLVHYPNTPDQELRAQFRSFPWQKNRAALHAWQKGMTGYPIVDAGMRQLWTTGWMHNRVRMIVGSFLVKDLMMDWREGAHWFWETLVDADLANNTLGWQWVAGCGADAAPYFRIFNPILQGGKFDPYGDYVRRWVPEIAALSNEWIHQPWMASEKVLAQANIVLGKTYPRPIVDHTIARKLALETYKKIRITR